MAGDADVLPGLRLYHPDVVVWDLGWETAAASRPLRHPTPPERESADTHLDHLSDVREAGQAVVVLVADSTDAVPVWAAGVRAILARDADVATLALALPAVAQGLVVLDPELAFALFPQANATRPAG